MKHAGPKSVTEKASWLKRHISTQRHAAAKSCKQRTAAKQQSIISSIKKFDEFDPRCGETFAEKERAYRLEVAETFLKAGVSLCLRSNTSALCWKGTEHDLRQGCLFRIHECYP